MRSIGKKLAVLLAIVVFPAAAQIPAEERTDLVPWRVFSQVKLVRQKDRYVPRFSPEVAALDQKIVSVRGFMIPLEMGKQQTHFLVSSLPQTCPFCLPGGPEAMVEVKSKTPVKYGFEPLVLSGKLSVLKSDPTGIFYRLTEAAPAQ